MTKAKSVIEIHRIKNGEREYYKGITVHVGSLTMWKALVNGMKNTTGIDIESLRSRRKRKGGK